MVMLGMLGLGLGLRLVLSANRVRVRVLVGVTVNRVTVRMGTENSTCHAYLSVPARK